jgi:nicotinate-nucleotide--dimethylbenzimidazole phosphoribosyltransferase
VSAIPPAGAHGGDGVAVAAALGLDPEEVLDLSQSLNPVAPDFTPVIEAHVADLRRYPDPTKATASLAKAMGVDTAQLLLTNGGAEAISLVAAEIGGWSVDPDFSLYPRRAPAEDVGRTRGDRTPPGTRARGRGSEGTGEGPLWRSNPHSPSGRLAPSEVRAGVWDEAFFPLATGRWTRGDPAVVVGSLTKLLACPGLRVGYVLGDPDIVERCRGRQPAWSVNGLVTAALAELLEPVDLPKWSAAVRDLREELVRLLRAHGLEPRPSDASWVLVDAPGLRERLAPLGIVVRDCASFALPGVVRIGVPSADGLARLDAALTRLRGPADGPIERHGQSPAHVRRRPARHDPDRARSRPNDQGDLRVEQTSFRSAAASVVAVDPGSAAAAAEHHDHLTKPRGSLGRLEEMGVRLCAIARICPPPVPEPVTVAVFAGDHGVVVEGVTPWPQEVTAQMVANFCAGGAAINVLARNAAAKVVVVDVGVAADLPAEAPGLLRRTVRRGTRNMALEAAMTGEEACAALEVGAEVARGEVERGARLLVTGDMGIGNTTPSAALVAALAGVSPGAVTGRGTGIDDPTLARKISVVERALQRVRPGAGPIEILCELGGLEIAALAGFMVGGAAERVPVVVDGVIAAAGALVAAALVPDVIGYLIAGHRSSEPGSAAALEHLGLAPLLDLDLRLGEGSGAMLAVPAVQAAAKILREMSTFDSAGVTDKGDPRS